MVLTDNKPCNWLWNDFKGVVKEPDETNCRISSLVKKGRSNESPKGRCSKYTLEPNH